jgi:hypothetical protein
MIIKVSDIVFVIIDFKFSIFLMMTFKVLLFIILNFLYYKKYNYF